MALLPKPSGHVQCFNFESLPPSNLIPGLVQVPVMSSTKRHRKFITDFETDRPRLRKAQMMGIGWLPLADQTRL